MSLFEPSTKRGVVASVVAQSLGCLAYKPYAHLWHRRKEAMPKKLTEPYSERVQLRVTKRQWLKVQALAFALDVPISEVVRTGMNDLIARMEGETIAEDEE